MLTDWFARKNLLTVFKLHAKGFDVCVREAEMNSKLQLNKYDPDGDHIICSNMNVDPLQSVHCSWSVKLKKPRTILLGFHLLVC